MINFFKQFILNARDTGAIIETGKKLAEKIVDTSCIDNASCVVEYGPGTGVLTEIILDRINYDSTFFALEINPYFVNATKKKCPEATVYHDSAMNIHQYLRRHGKKHCDCIISGLPWSSFPQSFQEDLLLTSLSALKPGGKFLTFAYLQGVLLPGGKRFNRLLQDNFSSVIKTETVWQNIPPGFVYCATR